MEPFCSPHLAKWSRAFHNLFGNQRSMYSRLWSYRLWSYTISSIYSVYDHRVVCCLMRCFMFVCKLYKIINYRLFFSLGKLVFKQLFREVYTRFGAILKEVRIISTFSSLLFVVFSLRLCVLFCFYFTFLCDNYIIECGRGACCGSYVASLLIYSYPNIYGFNLFQY